MPCHIKLFITSHENRACQELSLVSYSKLRLKMALDGEANSPWTIFPAELDKRGRLCKQNRHSGLFIFIHNPL